MENRLVKSLTCWLRLLLETSNIINVAECPLKALGDCVKEPLESLSNIPEPKRQPEVLKRSERCCDSCLTNICLPDWNLVVRLHQKNLGEPWKSWMWGMAYLCGLVTIFSLR